MFSILLQGIVGLLVLVLGALWIATMVVFAIAFLCIAVIASIIYSLVIRPIEWFFGLFRI
jgi:hypothetical protein